uniref:Uncharacterized protein n=1 Tax=Amphimedon queenslandica TaxID=400682 RepID=A0A1X7UCN3_AMPQE
NSAYLQKSKLHFEKTIVTSLGEVRMMFINLMELRETCKQIDASSSGILRGL